MNRPFRTFAAWLLAAGIAAAAAALPATTAQALSMPAADSATGADTSFNWSGYAATGGGFTAVSGTWTVPAVIGVSGITSSDAAWVGIGGVDTSDLIQAGTQGIAGPDGQVAYQAWYETLPQSSRPAALAVSAGDSVTATITEQSSNLWKISLTNNTTGQSFQTAAVYNSSLSSAEWVEEMPSASRGLVALDNFGSVQFSDAWAVQNGSRLNVAQANAQAITMTGRQKQALATPSALGADGASFSVTRSSAASAAGTTVGRTWQRSGAGSEGFSPFPQARVRRQRPFVVVTVPGFRFMRR